MVVALPPAEPLIVTGDRRHLLPLGSHQGIEMVSPALRKERGLTQQALADQVGIAALQVRRYEGGTSQPTLGVVRRLAIALGVSADMLVFDESERGPSDSLRYQFETIARLPEQEQEVVPGVLDALIVKNQVASVLQRVASPSKTTPPTKTPTKKKASGKRAAHANASR